MPNLFLSKPGTVAIVGGDDGESLPGRVELDGFAYATAIVYDANYQQATNQQFQSSLEDAIYMYVFGDQMGYIELHGIIFGIECSAGGGPNSGFEAVISYYKNNRASKRDTPVIVTLGDSKISGYLTTMSISSEKPEDRINRFSFGISALPDSDGTGEADMLSNEEMQEFNEETVGIAPAVAGVEVGTLAGVEVSVKLPQVWAQEEAGFEDLPLTSSFTETNR